MKTVLLILLFSSLLWGEEVHPYQVVVFRHAEKFITKKDHDAHLNKKGQRRAAYLVDFLLEGKQPIIDQENHEIAAVFVPQPYGLSYYYVRPTQTIIPLFHEAHFYRLEKSGKGVELIDCSHYKEAKTLFRQILGQKRFEGKTIVICWEHKYLPSLFNEYFPKIKKDLPHLGEERFDMVWVIRWEEEKPKGYTFYQKVDL